MDLSCSNAPESEPSRELGREIKTEEAITGGLITGYGRGCNKMLKALLPSFRTAMERMGGLSAWRHLRGFG